MHVSHHLLLLLFPGTLMVIVVMQEEVSLGVCEGQLVSCLVKSACVRSNVVSVFISWDGAAWWVDGC